MESFAEALKELERRVISNDDSILKRVDRIETREREYITRQTAMWFLGAWLGVQLVIFGAAFGAINNQLEKATSAIGKVSDALNDTKTIVAGIEGQLKNAVISK